MSPNDALRSIRYILNVPDSLMVEIVELGGYLVTQDEIVSYLKQEEDAGFERCPEEVLAYFLNGLVIYKRGKDDSRPAASIELPVTNNDVLKKLRVAFELKDTDIISRIEKVSSLRVSKTELSAFFRKRGHRNYRECGDQFLRYLFKSLAK